jgi:hypothetical protein
MFLLRSFGREAMVSAGAEHWFTAKSQHQSAGALPQAGLA